MVAAESLGEGADAEPAKPKLKMTKKGRSKILGDAWYIHNSVSTQKNSSVYHMAHDQILLLRVIAMRVAIEFG